MRSTLKLAGLLALSLGAACADQPGYPDDSAPDTEISGDGKADYFSNNEPLGTYSVGSADAGKFVKLTLKWDDTFRREVACDGSGYTPEVTEGRYKLTHGGDSVYIRFTAADGTLIDRYAYEVHGRQLRVRKVGSDDWQALMIEDNFGSVQSPYAGYYKHDYATGTVPDGGIHSLNLMDTGQFMLYTEATYACSAPGHSCTQSWSDGYTGSSFVYGTWVETAGGGGVTLTPHSGDRDGWKFDLKMDISGTSVALSAKDGAQELTGTLETIALYSGEHTVQAADLAGTWSVTQEHPNTNNDETIWGYAGGDQVLEQELSFDPETNEFCDVSANNRFATSCMIFQIAGDPSGGTLGLATGFTFSELWTLQLLSVSTDKIDARLNDDVVFHLTRK